MTATKPDKSKFNPLRVLILVLSALTLLFIAAFFVAIFQVATFFKLRNICCLYIVRPFCAIVLWIFGITYNVHYRDNLSEFTENICVQSHILY